MTFKITITRAPLAVEFEVGSIAEGVAILQQEDTELRKVASIADSLNGETTAAEAAGGETEAAPKKRGPKPKNQPDPSTAQAPAPIPIDTTITDKGMPAFLDRTATPAAPVAPVAPPAPPPPPPAPVAPVAPPSGILAGKVIAELEKRKAGSDENAKMLVAWLAAPTIGLVTADASFDDAISAVRLMPDDKLSVAATALSVA